MDALTALACYFAAALLWTVFAIAQHRKLFGRDRWGVAAVANFALFPIAIVLFVFFWGREARR